MAWSVYKKSDQLIKNEEVPHVHNRFTQKCQIISGFNRKFSWMEVHNEKEYLPFISRDLAFDLSSFESEWLDFGGSPFTLVGSGKTSISENVENNIINERVQL